VPCLRAAALPVLLASTLVVGACRGEPPAAATEVPPVAADRAAPPPAPDPAAPTGRSAEAVELRLTIPVGTTPAGDELVVEIRSVEAGGRRHVVIDTPDGMVDQHVVTDDEHWWWIPPVARPAIGEVTWIHIALADVEAAGGSLPDVVADARAPLPEPGEIDVGTAVAGHRVVEVERVSPDEDRLVLAGLEGTARLQRRRLPAATVVDLPSEATELADLPEAVHPALAARAGAQVPGG
jgi:hypothetical protein